MTTVLPPQSCQFRDDGEVNWEGHWYDFFFLLIHSLNVHLILDCVYMTPYDKEH